MNGLCVCRRGVHIIAVWRRWRHDGCVRKREGDSCVRERGGEGSVSLGEESVIFAVGEDYDGSW